MSIQENERDFIILLKTVTRDGVNELIEYLKKSDFFTAPASTKYHSSYEGGLCRHSLNVYDCLANKIDAFSNLYGEYLGDARDSIVIVSLLHDICKTNFYTVQLRNSKNEKTGQWEKVPYYSIDDKIPYGHGEKSVMMIETFMKLKAEERYAIRWHMGFTEEKSQYNAISAAIKMYPMVLALHEADLEASYLLEKEVDEDVSKVD